MARPLAQDQLKWYEEAKSLRSPHENDWRMASAYCLPRHYSSWTTDGHPSISNGAEAARRFAFDATGVKALPKYVAILERLATPRSMKWHTITSTNKDLRKIRRVRAYYDSLTDLLFRKRYEPKAKFSQSSAEVYTSMGVYGTGPKFVGRRKPSAVDRSGGVLYRACAMRDIFMLIDDDGDVTVVFRRFFLNARQFVSKWPELRDNAPKTIAEELKKPTPSEANVFEFVHVVHLRDDFDELALDSRSMPYSASYIEVKGQEYVGEEEGYRSMPYVTPRTFTEPGDPYGFSPAQQALPALGSVSAMKKTQLKQGQKAVDPSYIAHDDGVISGPGLDSRPGHVTYGGVSADGKMLVRRLETGNFRVSEMMIADERRDIEDSFFVTLFQILTETPEMTATEVMERVAEKAALLAPTMGRIQTEYLAPNIGREIDVLAEMGMLPEMPPELIEAEGEYELVYTSPLAKTLYAEEISGFLRSTEMALNVVNATQDPSHLDHFSFDRAVPEISEYMSVPARWMTTEEEKKAIAEGRQKAQQQQQMVDAAPAAASVLATAQKAQGGA